MADCGVDARGRAAAGRGVERVKGGAEFAQGLATEKTGKQEAVGNELGARFDEAADGIRCETEAEDADDEVVGGGGGGEACVLGRKSGVDPGGMARGREFREEGLLEASGGDEEASFERAVHVLEALGEVG